MITRRGFLTWISGAITSMVTLVILGVNGKKLTNAVIKSPGEPYGKKSATHKIAHIAVMSDLHVQVPGYRHDSPTYNTKAANAINDMLTFNPDAFILNGDIVHHGFVQEYDIIHTILNPIRALKTPIYPTLGNHEFYNRQLTDKQVVDLFTHQWGLTKPYHHTVVAGVHLVFLSPDYRAGSWQQLDWAWLSTEQLNWFEAVLSAHRKLDTLVFLHQPLNNTVEQSQYIDWISRTEQTTRIMEILSKNPQVKCWFSGHTHTPLTSAGQIVYRRGVWFLGGASTFYTYQIRPSNGKTQGPFLGRKFLHKIDFKASQSRLLSIYPEKIVVRGRDHIRRDWIKEYEFILPR